MHRSSIHEGLTLYDSSLLEKEAGWVRTSRFFHIFTWLLNVIVIIYLIYKITNDFESVFMGYIVFSVFALIASIIYARRYKSWYAHNILIYFILIIFIFVNFILFGAAIVAELIPAEAYENYREPNHTWWKVILTLCFFFVPVLHSLSIIYLFSVRKQCENRVLRERGGLKVAHGKQVLEYKPQVDGDYEKNLIGSKNMK